MPSTPSHAADSHAGGESHAGEGPAAGDRVSTRTRPAAARRLTLLLTATALACIDLTAKTLAEAHLPGHTVDLGLIQLRLAHNSGVAFSLGDTLPTWVVIAVTAAITLAITLYAWRTAATAGRVQQLAGAAVLAGAAANVVDRAIDGAVTDYLHTGWWPTFNLADTFIVTGAIALILATPGGRRFS